MDCSHCVRQLKMLVVTLPGSSLGTLLLGSHFPLAHLLAQWFCKWIQDFHQQVDVSPCSPQKLPDKSPACIGLAISRYSG